MDSAPDTPRLDAQMAFLGEADRLKDEFIGTEHLLIAITSEREGDAGATIWFART